MNKRETILSVALTEFSRNDFENASINMIIKEAKTSKGNFYYYFNNKEELYLTLLKEAWQKKMKYMSAIDENNNIFDFLQKQVMAGIKFSKENPEYYQISRRFAKEKNTTIYNRVLAEITSESKNKKINIISEMKYDRSIISDEFPNEFVDKLLLFVLDNINELIDEGDDIVKIEEKLLLIIKVLKNGLEQKYSER